MSSGVRYGPNDMAELGEDCLRESADFAIKLNDQEGTEVCSLAAGMALVGASAASGIILDEVIAPALDRIADALERIADYQEAKR